jgi:Short C-terminal domain
MRSQEFTFEAYMATVRVSDERLVISRRGLAAKTAGVERNVEFAHLTGVNVIAPTLAKNGHVQLVVEGEPTGPPRPVDPNTIVFTRQQRRAMNELVALLKQHVPEPGEAVAEQSRSERRQTRIDAKKDERAARKRAAGKPDAKLSLGLTSIKLYEDRVESPWGSGSLEGAQARIDSRGWRGQKTYVIIEGPHVAIGQKLSSNSGMARKAAEQFVAKVNSAAQRIGQAAKDPAPGGSGAVAQLEKLGVLRDSGVITEQEFQAKKADLLERI